MMNLYPRSPSLQAGSTEGAFELITGRGIERTLVLPRGSGIFLQAHGEMRDENGKPDGHYIGAMEPSAPINLKLLATPPPQPRQAPGSPGPIPRIPILGRNKIDFFFSDHGSLCVVGQGSAILTSQPDGTRLFSVSVMGLITGGSGYFEGATGVQAATGTAILKTDDRIAPGSTLHFTTEYSFHIARKATALRNSAYSQVYVSKAPVYPPSARSSNAERHLLEPQEHDPTDRRVDRQTKIVLKTVEQINSKRFNGYFKDYSPSCILNANGIAVEGIQEAEKFLHEGFIGVFPDIHLTVKNLVASKNGNQIAYDFLARGTKTRGFMGLPDTQKPYEFHGSNFLEFTDGLITKGTMTWNNAAILKKLGVIPESFAKRNVRIAFPLSSDLSFDSSEALLLGFVSTENSKITEQNSPFSAPMYWLDGSPSGYFEGITIELTKSQITQAIGQQSLAVGRVVQFPKLEDDSPQPYFKLTFHFKGKGAVVALAPFVFYDTKNHIGENLLMASAMGIITQGTGSFAGSGGLTSTTSSSLSPAGSHAPPPSKTFFALRITKCTKENVGPTALGHSFP